MEMRRVTSDPDIIVCYQCGELKHRRSYDDGDFICQTCHAATLAVTNERARAKRANQPQRPAQQITLSLTPQQFTYLQSAVKRDLENLEEMAPWDIDEHTEEHEAEVRMCKAMGKMLRDVEQTQVITH